MKVVVVSACFYMSLFVLSWHFVFILVVMFVLGIVFFACYFSGFGVEFLLAFLCFHVVLALRCSA